MSRPDWLLVFKEKVLCNLVYMQFFFQFQSLSKIYLQLFDFKYGKEKDVRIWLKAHAICGTKTNIITTIKVKMLM